MDTRDQKPGKKNQTKTLVEPHYVAARAGAIEPFEGANP
jgi:hypothetical protein